MIPKPGKRLSVDVERQALSWRMGGVDAYVIAENLGCSVVWARALVRRARMSEERIGRVAR